MGSFGVLPSHPYRDMDPSYLCCYTQTWGQLPSASYHQLSFNSHLLRFKLLISIHFQKEKGTWFWKRRLFSMRENYSLFDCSLFWMCLGCLIFAISIPQGTITIAHSLGTKGKATRLRAVILAVSYSHALPDTWTYSLALVLRKRVNTGTNGPESHFFFFHNTSFAFVSRATGNLLLLVIGTMTIFWKISLISHSILDTSCHKQHRIIE